MASRPRSRSNSFEQQGLAAGQSPAGGPPPNERELLCKMIFSLPADEEYLEDYSCAVQAKILLHGRMYLTSKNICFYSNLFGYEKKLVLLLRKRDLRHRPRAPLRVVTVRAPAAPPPGGV